MTDPFALAADLLDPEPDPLREEAARVGLSLRSFVRAAWPILEPGTPYLHNWHIDLVCEYLELVYSREITRLIINVPPRYMKPVEVDALVLMGDGSRKRLGEVEVGDEVVSHRGRPCRVVEIAEQGELDVVRLVTESGRIVAAAPDHPFFTPSGWVKAGDLAVGSCLASVVPDDRPPSPRSSEEFRLAGYFIGDGCTVGNAAVVTCFDPDEGDDLTECAEALGWSVRHSPVGGRYSMSRGVRPWLREVGLAGLGSWTKRVPDFVFEGDNGQVGEFLGAYFACDGTLNARWGRSGEKKRSDLTVTFNSVNRLLLEDVQHLLLRLGVRSRIRQHVGGGFKGEAYASWRLSVTSLDDTAKLVERMPVVGQKARRLAHWATRRTRFDGCYEPDLVVSIEDDRAVCRCLRVEGDSSFTANDLAVHNSSLCTVLGPTWDWIHRPHDRFLIASYAQLLSTKHSVDRRTVLQSPWYQERFGDRFRLSSDQNVKTEFTNNRRGHMIATSMRGTATGKGGDHVVIDDPLDPKQAPSATQREETNRLFDQVFSQRLDDKTRGTIVVVMQRLHERDLTGHLLDLGGWEHLKLPNPDERGSTVVYPLSGQERVRPAGDVLWPERESRAQIEEAKVALGSQAFAGQYGQEPAPAEGGIFRRSWWGFWRPAGLDGLMPVHVQLADRVYVAPLVDLPPIEAKLQSWDLSFKDTSSADYVVGQVWGASGARRFLLDQVRDRMAFTATIEAVKALTAAHPDAYAKLVEDKANGPAVIDALKQSVSGLLPVEPQGGKEARAHAVSPQVEAGQVFLPHPSIAPWVWDLIEELAVFPNAAHDDQVDALSQALIRLSAFAPLTTLSAGQVQM